jgi:beta-N-acetylhexosaminidase
MDKKQFIENKLSNMTLEQKVGQCLVLGYVGTVITPEIIQRIKKYTPAGIRVGFYWRIRTAWHDPGCTPPEFAHRMLRVPSGTMKDYIPGIPVPHVTNQEYCSFLNTLKQASLDSDLGLPLHITFDFEGDQSADYYHGGAHQFPNVYGLTVDGNPKNAYDMHWAIGTQLMPLGFSWTHSFVLDVNTNPMNPEIGVRSYGNNAETVIKYAKEAYKGWKDAGIIATGKHFPGRGESASDAHSGLPVIDLSMDEMEEHLKPYHAMIAEGMPAIMTAHTAYPKLEKQDIPATLSKTILTDLLKNDMGFEGAITTDAMAMGGIISRFEFGDALIKALNAGADLLLIRDEGPIIHEVFPQIVDAVKNGKLPESRLDDAITRTLGVKWDYGFFEENSLKGIKDPEKAGEGIANKEVINIVNNLADKVVTVLKDEQDLLPLSKDTKVLLIEQINPMHLNVNSQYCHPSIFWEKMLEQSENVGSIETDLTFTDNDRRRIKDRYDQADVIVITNYYGRRHLDGNTFVKEIVSWGKPTIVVTNSPYGFTVLPEYKTVVCTYGCSTELLTQAAKVIFGVE